jgi:hypothetical protein
MKIIRLNDVAFFEDLPVLLGISKAYAKALCSPPNTKLGDWYKAQSFPNPFYVSPSGIRVWFVKDLELWCTTIRMKRTRKRMLSHIGSTLLDRPSIADRFLGRQ